MAAPEVFRFYLERRLPEGAVETAQVELAFQLLGDRVAFQEFLEKLDPMRFEGLLGRLEAYEDDFPVSATENAAGAILDQMHRLRTGRAHIFDLGGEMALHRVVFRLFRRVEDQGEREAIVSSLLPTLRHISAMRSVVEIVSGHKLAPASTVAQWKTDVSSLVVASEPEKLAQERSLGILLIEAFDVGGEIGAQALHLFSDTNLFFRALVTLVDVQSSMAFGSVTSVQQLRLPWEALEGKFGPERLNAWFSSVLAATDVATLESHDRTVLELAEKYHRGWRPRDFGRPDPPKTQPAAHVSEEDEPARDDVDT